MARTYQSKRGQGTRARPARRPPSRRPGRLPRASKKRRFPYGDLKAKVLRGIGIFCLCVLVVGVGFAAGAYAGLVRSVDRLGEPQNVDTHPTYIYSAPLSENGD